MPITGDPPYDRETAEMLAELNNAASESGRTYEAVCADASKGYWRVAVYDREHELVGYI